MTTEQRRKQPSTPTAAPRLDQRWLLSNEAVTVNRQRTLGSGNFAVVHEGALFCCFSYCFFFAEIRLLDIEHFAGICKITNTQGSRKKNRIVAVKMIRLDEGALSTTAKTPTIPAIAVEDKHAKKECIVELNHEAIIMSFVRHPNVIEFIGYCDDKYVSFLLSFRFVFYGIPLCYHKKSLQQPFIALEFCTGGSLDAHIRSTQRNITTNDCIHFAYEISCAMRYLATINCVHSYDDVLLSVFCAQFALFSDLATRNILISTKGVLKVSDFGESF